MLDVDEDFAEYVERCEDDDDDFGPGPPEALALAEAEYPPIPE